MCSKLYDTKFISYECFHVKLCVIVDFHPIDLHFWANITRQLWEFQYHSVNYTGLLPPKIGGIRDQICTT